MINRDGGPEVPVSLTVSEAQWDDFLEISAVINGINSEFPLELKKREPRERPKRAWGTDSGPFAVKGVPTIGFDLADPKGYNFSYGEIWHTEHPVDADMIIPVPDGGVFAAMGYAQESCTPFEFGLIRNHYVGRTFIEPQSKIRHFGVKIKLNPIKALIKGKKIVLVDDSIVRSTTSKKIVELIRNAGAKEVHYRVSSPPYISPCYYGIDTPTREHLAAANFSVEEIRQHLGADTLGYLSIEGMLQSVEKNRDDFCLSCFTAKYPVDYPDDEENQLALFNKV